MTPRERTVTSGLSTRFCQRSSRGVVEPVEAAHLVGAVVRAVARADAAVVDLLVQALARCAPWRAPGRPSRTARSRSAGRASAGATHVDAVRRSSGVVAVDAHPVHLAAAAAPRPARRPARCSPPGRRSRSAEQPVQASRSIDHPPALCPVYGWSRGHRSSAAAPCPCDAGRRILRRHARRASSRCTIARAARRPRRRQVRRHRDLRGAGLRRAPARGAGPRASTRTARRVVARARRRASAQQRRRVDAHRARPRRPSAAPRASAGPTSREPVGARPAVAERDRHDVVVLAGLDAAPAARRRRPRPPSTRTTSPSATPRRAAVAGERHA